MEYSGLKIKKFLIFSPKKTYLIFQEMKLLIFPEVTFRAVKIFKNLIFQEIELSDFIFFLYFGKWNFTGSCP